MGWKDTIKDRAVDDEAPSAGGGWRDTIRDRYSAGGSAVRGLTEGATFGYADEIKGGMEALGSLVGVRGMGGNISDTRLERDDEDDEGFSDVYRKARDRVRSEYAQAKKDHPTVYGASELAGAVGSAFVPGLGAAGNTFKGAIGMGAASGLGMSDADLLEGEYGQAALDTGIGGAVGGIAQKAVPFAIDKVRDYGGKALKAIGNIGFGVGKEATERYLDDPKLMRQVIEDGNDGLLALKDRADEAYDRLVEEPRRAASELVDESKLNLREARADYRDELARLRNVRPPQISDSVVKTVRAEDKQLSDLSGEAFKTLDGSEFERKDMLGVIGKIKEGLLVDGQAPVIGNTVPAWSVLSRLEKTIQNGSDEAATVAGEDLKRYIQGLDQESADAYTTYGSRGAARHIKAARDRFDEPLKAQVPAYRDAMIPTAEQAQLVGQLKSVFGDAQKAERAIALAGDPQRGKHVRAMLERLDKKNGSSFMADIAEFHDAQKLLRDPQARIALKDKMSGSQESLLDVARQQRNESIQNARQFSRAHPKSMEKTLKKVGRDMDDEGRQAIESLMGASDPADGQKFLKELKDYSLGMQFRTDKTNGSRKTMLGGVLGGLIGSAAGGVGIGSIAGSAAGAAAGASIDKFGGVVWQKLLDGSLKAGPYAKVLERAAKSGPGAVGATHLYLMQHFPDYRASVDGAKD